MTATRTRRSLLSRSGKSPKVRIGRKTQTPRKPATRVLRPVPNPDQGTTPTEIGNIVSTASCRTTLKRIVSKESGTRNHVRTNRDVPTGPEFI
jgi:hypothetical protein